AFEETRHRLSTPGGWPGRLPGAQARHRRDSAALAPRRGRHGPSLLLRVQGPVWTRAMKPSLRWIAPLALVGAVACDVQPGSRLPSGFWPVVGDPAPDARPGPSDDAGDGSAPDAGDAGSTVTPDAGATDGGSGPAGPDLRASRMADVLADGGVSLDE